MCEAARKQWRKNKRIKIAKEEALKSKQVRVKEENNKQAKEDSVSAYSLISCLWRAPWFAGRTKMFAYTGDMRGTTETDAYMLQSQARPPKRERYAAPQVPVAGPSHIHAPFPPSA